MKDTITEETVITRTILLTGADIDRLLYNIDPIHGLTSSRHVRVTFTVPGGGDWSHQTIDIDEEHPITVVITRTRTT